MVPAVAAVQWRYVLQLNHKQDRGTGDNTLQMDMVTSIEESFFGVTITQQEEKGECILLLYTWPEVLN